MRGTQIDILLQSALSQSQDKNARLDPFDLVEKAEARALEVPALQDKLAAVEVVRSELHLVSSDYPRAVTAATRALDLFKELKTFDVEWRNRALHTLAIAYHYMGNNAAALEITYEQIRACRDSADARGLAQALNRSAAIHTRRAEHKAAIEADLEALDIVRQQNDEQWIAVIMGNIAQNYKHLGDYDLALEFSQAAVDMARRSDKPSQLARILIQFADICSGADRYPEAHRHLAEAEVILKKGSARNMAWIIFHSTYATLYASLRQPAKAVKHWQHALKQAQTMQRNQLQYEAHKGLATAYEQLGDFERALHHFRRFSELREKAREYDNYQKLRNLEVMYRTQQALHEANYYQERTRDLEQNRQYLERLSDMKDQMMNTATHDLKNPLSVILTTTHTLRKKFMNSEMLVSRLARIEHQVHRMTALIGDLLDLAKLETGSAVELAPIYLDEVVNLALQDLEVTAQGKNIELVAPSSTGLKVQADAGKLRLVFNNLLSNAINYSDNGRHVYLDVIPNGAVVGLRVRDEGIGIPEAEIEQVFERFYRVQAPQHQSREGTGLGLAIVKSIVEQHGSEISVSSTIGAGSTFSFTLPIVQNTDHTSTAEYPAITS